jgi:hypothetical protein
MGDAAAYLPRDHLQMASALEHAMVMSPARSGQVHRAMPTRGTAKFIDKVMHMAFNTMTHCAYFARANFDDRYNILAARILGIRSIYWPVEAIAKEFEIPSYSVLVAHQLQVRQARFCGTLYISQARV